MDAPRFTLAPGGRLEEESDRSAVLTIELERAAEPLATEPWSVLSTPAVPVE